MTAVIHKISVGAGGKHTLSPEESLRRSVSFGKLVYAHNRSRANTRACYYGDEDKVGVPQNIMRAHCAVMRPDHLKFASYGPVVAYDMQEEIDNKLTIT